MPEPHERPEVPAAEPDEVPISIVTLEPGQAASGVVVSVQRPGAGGANLAPVTVRIPAGINDDTLLRVPGPKAPGAAPVSFLVRVRVSPSPQPPPGPPPAAAAPSPAPPPIAPPPIAPPTAPLPPMAPPTAPLPPMAPPAAPLPPMAPPDAAPYTSAAAPYTSAAPPDPYAPPSRYASPDPYASAPLSDPYAAPSQPWNQPRTHTSPGPARPRRAWRPIGIAAGAVVTLLALALILTLNRGDTPSGSASGSASSSSTSSSPEAIAAGQTADPTPSPSESETPPGEYAQMLAAIDAVLAEPFAALKAAKTPSAISTAATNAKDAVHTQADLLRSTYPPAQVAAQHADVVTALDALADDLGRVGTDADSKTLCGGASAIASLSRSTAADQVRTAVAALAAADPAQGYRIGAFLPASTPDPQRRLANGYFMKAPRGGIGAMKITNGGTQDAVVTLTRSDLKTVVGRVYVRAGATSTFSGVPDGSFPIFLTTGDDWDTDGGRFTRGCAFQRFDQPADFRTTPSTYTSESITVTPVLGGNATLTDVDPDAFPAT